MKFFLRNDLASDIAATLKFATGAGITYKTISAVAVFTLAAAVLEYYFLTSAYTFVHALERGEPVSSMIVLLLFFGQIVSSLINDWYAALLARRAYTHSMHQISDSVFFARYEKVLHGMSDAVMSLTSKELRRICDNIEAFSHIISQVSFSTVYTVVIIYYGGYFVSVFALTGCAIAGYLGYIISLKVREASNIIMTIGSSVAGVFSRFWRDFDFLMMQRSVTLVHYETVKAVDCIASHEFHRTIMFSFIRAITALSISLPIFLFVYSNPPNIAVLAVVIMSTSSLVPQVSQLIAQIASVRSCAPVVHAFQDICTYYGGKKSAFRKTLTGFGRMDVENLSIKCGSTIIGPVAFVIRSGSVFALVGPSGSGKTSILRAILGMVPPINGIIKVDGIDIYANDIELGAVVVSQGYNVIGRTIRDCLIFGADEVSEQQMWHALCKVNLSKRCASALNGIDEEIGERGLALSGGERQRLAMARAIVSKQKLLVLDEPTSCLDAENEDAVFSLIREIKGDMTVLITTHSKKVVDVCDNYFEMNCSRPMTLARACG